MSGGDWTLSKLRRAFEELAQKAFSEAKQSRDSLRRDSIEHVRKTSTLTEPYELVSWLIPSGELQCVERMKRTLHNNTCEPEVLLKALLWLKTCALNIYVNPNREELAAIAMYQGPFVYYVKKLHGHQQILEFLGYTEKDSMEQVFRRKPVQFYEQRQQAAAFFVELSVTYWLLKTLIKACQVAGLSNSDKHVECCMVLIALQDWYLHPCSEEELAFRMKQYCDEGRLHEPAKLLSSLQRPERRHVLSTSEHTAEASGGPWQVPATRGRTQLSQRGMDSWTGMDSARHDPSNLGDSFQMTDDSELSSRTGEQTQLPQDRMLAQNDTGCARFNQVNDDSFQTMMDGLPPPVTVPVSNAPWPADRTEFTSTSSSHRNQHRAESESSLCGHSSRDQCDDLSSSQAEEEKRNEIWHVYMQHSEEMESLPTESRARASLPDMTIYPPPAAHQLFGEMRTPGHHEGVDRMSQASVSTRAMVNEAGQAHQHFASPQATLANFRLSPNLSHKPTTDNGGIYSHQPPAVLHSQEAHHQLSRGVVVSGYDLTPSLSSQSSPHLQAALLESRGHGHQHQILPEEPHLSSYSAGAPSYLNQRSSTSGVWLSNSREPQRQQQDGLHVESSGHGPTTATISLRHKGQADSASQMQDPTSYPLQRRHGPNELNTRGSPAQRGQSYAEHVRCKYGRHGLATVTCEVCGLSLDEHCYINLKSTSTCPRSSSLNHHWVSLKSGQRYTEQPENARYTGDDQSLSQTITSTFSSSKESCV